MSVSRPPAFTLLELLVSMAVLAVLAVVLLAIVESGTTLWRKSENRVDAYREVRAALGIIARDFQNALAPSSTNYFLFNSHGAFARLPSGAQADAGRAGAVFFLSALPASGQPPGSKSDVCEVGYFVAFSRTFASTNETLNLNRFFRSSDSTFSNLVFSNNFNDAAIGAEGEELLARNIRSFRVTPFVVTNGVPSTNFTASTNAPLPDLLEIAITAVNQDAAKRFPSSADWTSPNAPPGIAQEEQTFAIRVVLPRKP